MEISAYQFGINYIKNNIPAYDKSNFEDSLKKILEFHRTNGCDEEYLIDHSNIDYCTGFEISRILCMNHLQHKENDYIENNCRVQTYEDTQFRELSDGAYWAILNTDVHKASYISTSQPINSHNVLKRLFTKFKMEDYISLIDNDEVYQGIVTGINVIIEEFKYNGEEEHEPILAVGMPFCKFEVGYDPRSDRARFYRIEYKDRMKYTTDVTKTISAIDKESVIDQMAWRLIFISQENEKLEKRIKELEENNKI